MKTYFTWITIALTIVLFGCDKEDANLLSGDENNYPSFTGYTSTDNNGAPTWLNDPTDWVNDTNWISSEEDLFPLLQFLTSDVEAYSTIQFHPAYPNPTSSNTNFQLSKASDIRLSFRVVDDNFNIIASSDSIYSNSFTINTINIVSPADTMVRMYYLFERNDSCLYKGHGDIKIN